MLLGLACCRPAPSRAGGPPRLSAEALSDPIVATLAKCGYGRVRRVTELFRAPGSAATHLRYDTDEGPVFCKRSQLPNDVFASEAASLRVLRSAALMGGYLRIPKSLGFGSLQFGGSFLLLEWIEPSHVLGLLPPTQEELGLGLAALHCAPQPPPRRGFGFECDTHIGQSRQDNRWTESFANFFVNRRLGAKFDEIARGANSNREQVATLQRLREPLLCAADLLLRDLSDPPALLHGDLWLGNVGANAAEQPVLYGADLFKLYHYLNHLTLVAKGSGHQGATEEPQIYYELTAELMRRIISNANL